VADLSGQEPWVSPHIPGAERASYMLTPKAHGYLDDQEMQELEAEIRRDERLARRQTRFIIAGSASSVILAGVLAAQNLWGIW